MGSHLSEQLTERGARVRAFTITVVRGFLLAGSDHRAAGESINFGSGGGSTIGELVNTLVALVGRKVDIVVDSKRVRPEKSEVLELIAATARAKTLLGWAPAVSCLSGWAR